MSNHFYSLSLRQPTDFLILEAFSNGENYTAGAIAHRIQNVIYSDHEITKENVNTRLPELENYGLLEKVPAIGRSGLYRISEAGLIALDYKTEYDNPNVDFLELIENELDSKGGSDG